MWHRNSEHFFLLYLPKTISSDIWTIYNLPIERFQTTLDSTLDNGATNPGGEKKNKFQRQSLGMIDISKDLLEQRIWPSADGSIIVVENDSQGISGGWADLALERRQ